MYLDPSDEGIHRLIDRNLTGPVVMLNLLRFRPMADYSANPHLAPHTPISGREAYDRYVEHTMPFLAATGGSVVFLGEGGHYVIGPTDERWDLVMLVRQTSIESFVAFASDEAYMSGVGHRTAALEDSRLLPLAQQARPSVSPVP